MLSVHGHAPAAELQPPTLPARAVRVVLAATPGMELPVVPPLVLEPTPLVEPKPLLDPNPLPDPLLEPNPLLELVPPLEPKPPLEVEDDCETLPPAPPPGSQPPPPGPQPPAPEPPLHDAIKARATLAMAAPIREGARGRWGCFSI